MRSVEPQWRKRVSLAALVLISASSAAFAFHLTSSFLEWNYLPRGPFDDFVVCCMLCSLLAILLSMFSQGVLRAVLVVAGLIGGYLWWLVAVLSFI